MAKSQSPPCVGFLIQVISLLATLVVIKAFSSGTLSLFEWAMCQGVVAALLSVWMRMATWWIVIHLLFMPAITVTLASWRVPVLVVCSIPVLIPDIWEDLQDASAPLSLQSRSDAGPDFLVTPAGTFLVYRPGLWLWWAPKEP